MYSAISRLNAVLAYSLTVLTVLTFLCFLSTAFNDNKLDTKATAIQPVVLKTVENTATGPERKDKGVMKLDIQANLSDLFNWNTKQLFVMLIAHYETDRNVVNQLVLWDKIIKRGDSAHLNFRNIKPKYSFYDDGHGLRGHQNVSLQLCWNVVPLAGRLPLVRSGSTQITFPNVYNK